MVYLVLALCYLVGCGIIFLICFEQREFRNPITGFVLKRYMLRENVTRPMWLGTLGIYTGVMYLIAAGL